jgi:hypothetical protein
LGQPISRFRSPDVKRHQQRIWSKGFYAILQEKLKTKQSWTVHSTNTFSFFRCANTTKNRLNSGTAGRIRPAPSAIERELKVESNEPQEVLWMQRNSTLYRLSCKRAPQPFR